jgi:hypothetical protein
VEQLRPGIAYSIGPTHKLLKGAKTLSIMTLSMMALSIMTLNIMTLSIMTLGIVTLSMMTLNTREHSMTTE